MPKRNIAVVGAGISGLAAAWLLSRSCTVSLYEKQNRLGGHCNTVNVGQTPVDTGFIVYNKRNYPNLAALFAHLGMGTIVTDMSFSASFDRGKFEYGGGELSSLIAQKRNLFRPRFWRMIRDIIRFYCEAPLVLARDRPQEQTLGEYLTAGKYSDAFINNHLLAMGAAIWSIPVETMMAYPLVTFVRFCHNHGLLQFRNRPQWRSVSGGSREYVKRMAKAISGGIILNCEIVAAGPLQDGGAYVEDRNGHRAFYDEIVLACHADQALNMLCPPGPTVQNILSAFRYERNLAVLHSDEALMPKNRKIWSSWNYLSERMAGKEKLCVTYWMNRLQRLDHDRPLFVTLNPSQPPRKGRVIESFQYEHPSFDAHAIGAQKLLASIQGKQNIWYCGSYFGYGFHEDALLSGLAVAEAIGGIKRPWAVERDGRHPHIMASSPSLAVGAT
ncbi:MAG: FAD-dependent oxidoreductase [Hyphomicrobiales bacterium]